MVRRGIPDAQINAALMPLVMNKFQQLSIEKLPNGKPLLEDHDKQNFQQMMKTGDLRGAISNLSLQSKTHAESIKTKLAERKENETERHNLEMEKNQTRKTDAVVDSGFTPEMGHLMAALSEQGVSIPAGFRSKAQQVQLYKGLLDRNQGKSPDEIATLIKTGQIEFGAQKKETQTAAGVAGKVLVAQNEIEEFAPLVREASAKVGRGKFVPITKLLQMKDASISDPDLKTLKVRINAMLNAYDLLAGRGGTDKDKRAEAHTLLTSSESPEALEAGLRSFELEAAAAHRAAVRATKATELPNKTSTSGAPSGTGKTLTYDPETGSFK